MPVLVYTDGSSSIHDLSGGWGYFFTHQGKTYEGHGGEGDTTNNRMELTAFLNGAKKALEIAPDQTIIVFSDSQYVVKGTTEWMFGWKARGWRTADKKPVKNQDIWEEVMEFVGLNLNVRLEWVKGHAGHQFNEHVDRLAHKGRMEYLASLS